MFCDQCGSENPTQNRFCGQCGAKLEARNGEIPDALHAPLGPVSSEFRREVEQQQLRLQRLDDQPVRNYSELATASHVESATPDAHSVSEDRVDARVANMDAQRNDAESYTDSPISGPSFLGLGGTEPADQQDLAYLYDDEPKPGRARKLLALFIAVVFLAFVAYEWKQNPNWQTTIVGKLINRSAANGAASPVQQNPPAEQGSASANIPATANSSEQSAAGPAQSGQANGAQQANTGAQDAASQSQGESASSNAQNKPEDQVAHGAVSTTPDSRADRDSTGAAGEQTLADGEEGDAGEASHSTPLAKIDQESRPAKEAKVSRKSAPVRAAKAEEPGRDLVTKAERYLYGRGVRQNCEQALVYLRTAAEKGNATARSKLGALYATGHCVPLDRAEAYNWFTLAREAGNNNIWLERNREMLWSKMTADEKARAMQPPR